MALDKERNEQIQQPTYLEEERYKLSASLANTLTDTALQEDDWEEEEMMRDVQGDIVRKTSLIPPRLSLQSKVLPAIQPARPTQTLAVPAAPIDEEHKGTTTETNVFMRLARRLTSSFAPFGVALPTEEATPSTTSVRNISASAPASNTQFDRRTISPPHERKAVVVDAVSSTTAHSLHALAAPQAPSEGRRRLAGTTKVRLETTPLQVVTPRPTEAREQTTRVQPPLVKELERVSLAQQKPTIENNSTTWPSPLKTRDAAQVIEEDRKQTSMQLPVVTMLPDTAREGVESRPQPTFGNGHFTSGQSDKMVENKNIIASSVVLVTLTTNPGPVVIQYISLHPQVGFTVHLTAPTVGQTSFNYAILSDQR